MFSNKWQEEEKAVYIRTTNLVRTASLQLVVRLQQIQPNVRVRNIRSHRQPSLIQQFWMRCIRHLDTINLHTHVLGRLQDLDTFIRILGMRVYPLIFLEPCVRLIDGDFRVAREIARREKGHCSRGGLVTDNKVVYHAICIVTWCCFVCEMFLIRDGGLREIVNRVVRPFPSFGAELISYLFS